jgi:hypothetical protein
LSTAGDVLRFMQALFDGRLITPASLAQMTTTKDRMGMGLMPRSDASLGPGRMAWGHDGSIDAFRAMALYVPAERTAVVWLGNAHRMPFDALTAALRRAVFDAQAPVPTYRMRRVNVDFVAEWVPRGGEAPPAALSLRGDAAPLSWFHNLPLRRDPGDPTGTRWQAQVALNMRDGLPAQYKLVQGEAGWERTPNRLLELPPGATQFRSEAVFDHDAERLALRERVLALDAGFFNTFHARDAKGLSAHTSPQLEFFHDRTGLSDATETLRRFGENFATASARGMVVERRLLPGSEVQPLGDWGAVHLGRHRFCNRPKDAPPAQAECSVYRFIHHWQAGTGSGADATPWRLARVLSLDH